MKLTGVPAAEPAKAGGQAQAVHARPIHCPRGRRRQAGCARSRDPRAHRELDGHDPTRVVQRETRARDQGDMGVKRELQRPTTRIRHPAEQARGRPAAGGVHRKASSRRRPGPRAAGTVRPCLDCGSDDRHRRHDERRRTPPSLHHDATPLAPASNLVGTSVPRCRKAHTSAPPGEQRLEEPVGALPDDALEQAVVTVEARAVHIAQIEPQRLDVEASRPSVRCSYPTTVRRAWGGYFNGSRTPAGRRRPRAPPTRRTRASKRSAIAPGRQTSRGDEGSGHRATPTTPG